MNYALREALRLVMEEGLEARFERHMKHAKLLWDGLEALGLPMLVAEENRLPTLSTPQLPAGLEDVVVRKRLLNEFNIEMASWLTRHITLCPSLSRSINPARLSSLI